jgi:phage/plasmid primase-like uncharacterized protein
MERKAPQISPTLQRFLNLGWDRDEIDSWDEQKANYILKNNIRKAQPNGPDAEADSAAPELKPLPRRATGGSAPGSEHHDGYTAQIIAQMTAGGIEAPPDRIIADGNIHRFVSRPGSRKKHGWYVVHPDPVAPTWAFGDWSLGIKERGEGDPGRELTPEETAARKKRQREQQDKIEAEEARAHEETAVEAQQRWDQTGPAPKDHGYLKTKQINPCGTRIEGRNLIIAMRDIEGKLWSLQEISPDGNKHNQPGGRRKGCFFQIGEIGDTFCIGEGFSTCASLHMATGYAVISAGEAGNLEAVARALREKYPNATIIVCGDDDWRTKQNGKPHNTGKIKAQKAAEAVDGAVALPWFSESARPQWATDFNDQARLSGLDDVKDTIRLARVKHDEDRQRQRDAEPPPATPEDFGLSSEAVTLEDFRAYMPLHSYIYTPSREMWPAASVNSRIPPILLVDTDGSLIFDEKGKEKLIAANKWLDVHRPVEQMTWAPGLPMVIPNRLVAEGGWIERDGVSCFNLYRPPIIEPGNAHDVGPWLDHVCKVYGPDADQIIVWLAHRVQRPQEKINHALVFGGKQGIGKDTILEPVKYAVGPWNFVEVSPQHLLGRFNGFVKSVILRISEARDLGDVDRFQFYDHMKTYTAAPPDVLRVDEKNLREYSVFNCCGVIITTNHKTDGIFLRADDRRHFVAWSDLDMESFPPDYWNQLYKWYASGGIAHVAAYLATLDISAFDAKTPPPKTDAFWAIVDASRAPEDAELADVLDRLGNPDATTISRIASEATGGFQAWMMDRKNRRLIPHRMEQCGYVPIRNDTNSQGFWIINGARQVIYAKSTLSLRDQFQAARRLTDQ